MKKVFAAIGAAFLAVALISSSSAAQLLPQNGGSSEIAQSGPEDIVDTAVGAGSFNTLAAALTAAGLVDTLKGDGPFTVFAPTDDAFAKLPEGTVDALLADIPALTDILLYHVVAGSVPAADVVTLDSAATVQGSDVSIAVVDGGVVLNDSVNVTATDVFASNGVIHVIDTVLLPPAEVVAPAPGAAGNAGFGSDSGIGAGWLALIGIVAAAGLLGGARLATNARRN